MDVKAYIADKELERFKKRANDWDWKVIEDDYMDMFYSKLSEMHFHPSCNATKEIMGTHGFEWDIDKQCFTNKEGLELKW